MRDHQTNKANRPRQRHADADQPAGGHQHQRRQQRAFVGQPPQRQPAQPVDTGQQYQNGRTFQPRPGKKEQTERAQHDIAQPFGTNPVDRQRQRQEHKQKLYG